MRNPWKLTTFALVAVLATAVGRDVLNTASAEPQPRMQAAREQLRSAEQSLEILRLSIARQVHQQIDVHRRAMAEMTIAQKNLDLAERRSRLSKTLFDLEGRYKFNDSFSLALGGENIFNTYPDKEKNGTLQFLGVKYALTSPFGFNGAFWYLRFKAEY